MTDAEIHIEAQKLLEHYPDIPSIDRARKWLIEYYGKEAFEEIRSRASLLWLGKNGFQMETYRPVAQKENPQEPLKQQVRQALDKQKNLANNEKTKVRSKITVNGRLNASLSDNHNARVLLKKYGSIEGIKRHENMLKVAFGAKRYQSILQEAYEILGIAPPEEKKSAKKTKKTTSNAAVSPVKIKKPSPIIVSLPNTKTPDDETIKRVEVTYGPSYSDAFNVDRKAMEIFDTMKELGFHKCGKPFTCSCCGNDFEMNQGIVCDTRELYLCNQCRGGQRKRERTTKSLRTISIPMGNKR